VVAVAGVALLTVAALALVVLVVPVLSSSKSHRRTLHPFPAV
jgi:uncharacterized protein YoxC